MTRKTRFYVRELIQLDAGEEPDTWDVLAVTPTGFAYSPDVYASEGEAIEAAHQFAQEGETAADWDETKHPGIDTTAEPVA